MFYKDWETIYKKISEDLIFSIEQDKKAADIFNKLLQNRKLFSINELKNLISGKEVFVFGAGPSLETSIILNKKKFCNHLKIASDGATSALMENNILPDLIVTDLDGKVSDQKKANSKGCITIIHAHGDNIENIKKYVPKFKGKILGTTQTDPKPYSNLQNFGGFTDGDRAIFLSRHFKAKKIFLIGFDFNKGIGKYSFPKKKNKNLKLKKLRWCKYLIELLKKEKQNIQEL